MSKAETAAKKALVRRHFLEYQEIVASLERAQEREDAEKVEAATDEAVESTKKDTAAAQKDAAKTRDAENKADNTQAADKEESK